MLMLGLDTATAVTTVALVRAAAGADPQVLGERSHRDPRRHGEVLAVQIDEVLREAGVAPADLDSVAVGVGPGAFTGLRVGLATAQALGLALQIPVHGACTLDILAFATGLSAPFAIVTDARRRELFWAVYQTYDVRSVAPVVGAPATAIQALGGLTVISPPGTPAVDGLVMVEGGEPSASVLCLLVASQINKGKPSLAVEPLYLRQPDVTPSAGPKSVLP